MSLAPTSDKEAQANKESTAVHVRSRGPRSPAPRRRRRGTNIVSALVDTVTRLVVQELLEAEQADYLGGRARPLRAPGDQPTRIEERLRARAHPQRRRCDQGPGPPGA